MRNINEVDDAIKDAMYMRCATFKEDMLRMSQVYLCTIETWVPSDSTISGLFLRVSEAIGKLRCRFYGHHFLLDPKHSVIHCVSCAHLKEYG